MKQEIEKHIGTLKDGKALGVDNLLVEILKASREKVVEWIKQETNNKWRRHPRTVEGKHNNANI